MTVNDIVARINQAGNAIVESIKAENLDNANRWYEQRQTAINELIACYPAHIAKNTLRDYLLSYAEQDQALISHIYRLRTELQKTLKSFGQLRHYING